MTRKLVFTLALITSLLALADGAAALPTITWPDLSILG